MSINPPSPSDLGLFDSIPTTSTHQKQRRATFLLGCRQLPSEKNLFLFRKKAHISLNVQRVCEVAKVGERNEVTTAIWVSTKGGPHTRLLYDRAEGEAMRTRSVRRVLCILWLCAPCFLLFMCSVFSS